MASAQQRSIVAEAASLAAGSSHHVVADVARDQYVQFVDAVDVSVQGRWGHPHLGGHRTQ
ncbi:hypothetical protein [Streptomyces sp. NBC_00847]|uniref:hypothetical protein n=1 Tax=Streptomyces sp. NBC_00847 TaxID=2975850 RepID=UPI00225B7EFE|nr:hypothetical protein [Streptomyces sp. NBC_00847]MCX4884619.1 hypothetical protein [Streptomyces sp. NBC_00847]